MKKIILATAALTLFAGSAFADAVNSNGDRKYDAASLIQAGEYIVQPQTGIDTTATAAIDGASDEIKLNSKGERRYDSAPN
jgi:hypothetical protein